MSKKGQLTIFIIIGILLVLAIAIFLYLQREELVPVEAERVRAIAVPVEMQPLRDFIQTCMNSVAKEGLQIIGGRGGYIEPRQRYNPFEPTAGVAVQFAPDSELKVPFWWHLSSRNDCVGDCVFESEQPPLTRAQGGARSIEGQLDAYLAENLPACFRDFAAFTEQQFTITPTGALEPETRIAQKNVIVLLTYPLEVRRAGETFALKDFVTELPVNLGEIYLLATNITNLEAQHSFLERATRNLIDIFGRTSERALPPVTELEFGFGMGTLWTKMDVEEKIKEMLTSYIPLLRVTYTRNYRFFPARAGKDREFYEVLYNRGFTVPVLEPHQDLEVKFVYLPWWKPYLDLNCNGQICQPEGFSSTIGFLFGVRRYTFAYDISYPVLVEITNPGAFGGEGYTFRFFLEANMRNNEPLATLEPPLAGPVFAERSSLLCDPGQRTGGNISINVRTSAGQPVDDAEIVYRCGTETCSIGTSANGKLVAPFPRCVGGFISANHVDYAPAVQPLDVLDERPQTADLILGIAYPVDFAVKKWLLRKKIDTERSNETHTFYQKGWVLDTSQAVNQGPREQAIIMLEKKGQEFEEPITVFADVCGAPFAKAPIPCGSPPSDTSQDVLLYSGDYRVIIYAFQYPSPPLQIPPDRRCFSGGPFSRRRCFWIPAKPIIFSADKPLMSGYAEFDWTIAEDDLKAAKSIEFYYINFALDKVLPPSGRKVEDLEILGNLFTYSAQYPDLLRPKIT
jgi:hypothetical protein